MPVDGAPGKPEDPGATNSILRIYARALIAFDRPKILIEPLEHIANHLVERRNMATIVDGVALAVRRSAEQCELRAV